MKKSHREKGVDIINGKRKQQDTIRICISLFKEKTKGYCMEKRIIPSRMIYILFLLMTIISCKSVNKNVNIGNEQKDDNDLYKSICWYINNNREEFLYNSLKGINHYGLEDEQALFFSKRLDFFMAILNNNNEIKLEYYDYEKYYYRLFPQDAKYLFFWSKDALDFRLFYTLKGYFGEIKLPLDMIYEFYKTEIFRGNTVTFP